MAELNTRKPTIPIDEYMAGSLPLLDDKMKRLFKCYREDVTANLAPDIVRDIGADKVEFKFKKPQSLQIGGSYAIQGIAKPNVNVDLMLCTPKRATHTLKDNSRRCACAHPNFNLVGARMHAPMQRGLGVSTFPGMRDGRM
ncbi:hypothetical protein CRG98_021588 [Punica granatum]|uniref:Uncharacterized protein n=1 Tax=Punica granatum TaxID=22663 RepID=A0A2I0JNY2_PUNGR|nr:hypothetical protein CRG98_021588 [Punica granatum]